MPQLNSHHQFTWRRAAPFVAAAAVVGVVVVVLVHAAAPLAAFEAESGTVSGGATVANLTGQSGTGVVKFTSPTPTPTPTPSSTPVGSTCPAYPAFPDGSCTGATSASGSLVHINTSCKNADTGAAVTGFGLVNGDCSLTTANHAYSGYLVDGKLVLSASGITLSDTIVRCSGVTDFCLVLDSNSEHVNHVEVGPSSGQTTAIGVYTGGDNSANVITNANIHDTSDGMRSDGGITLQDSWIHHLNFCCDVHSDGSQTTQGFNMTFDHNTIEGGNDDALFFKTDDGSQGNITINHNQLLGVTSGGQITSSGVGVSQGSGRTVTNVNVTNNVFNKTWQSGPSEDGYNWTTFSGNKYTDGTAVNP